MKETRCVYHTGDGQRGPRRYQRGKGGEMTDKIFVKYCDQPGCKDCRIARLESVNAELLAALERAVPWLGKMIADKGHLAAVLPRDAEIALEQAETAIANAGKA